MLVLALDTTTSVCSVALAKEGKLLAETSTNLPRTHSQRLLPLIDLLFQEAKLTPAQVDLVAVTRGPGSFTGLRIGIATAKALGLALGVPVAGASTLQVLAHNLGGVGLVCPVLNARRGQVYTALFHTGQDPFPRQILPEQAMTLQELAGHLEAVQQPIWFCGDGAELAWAELRHRLADPRLTGLHHAVNRAAALAALTPGLKPADPDQLVPVYLRESQAEIQRRQKEGRGYGG